MCNNREPYTFKRCMFFAYHDILRVSKHWRNCNLKREFKCILMEIKHGVFDQGK